MIKWVLILVLVGVGSRYGAMEKQEGFNSLETCQAAGDKFVEHFKAESKYLAVYAKCIEVR